MPIISVRAHFDGTNIQLDEPFELPPNAPLLVTVLSSAHEELSKADWAELGKAGLNRAYGEAEPEYSSADLRS